MPVSAAQQLVDLIAQAVKDIEADVATHIPGGTITEVNSPIVAPEDTAIATPKRRAALRNLQAATHQLLATMMPAGLYGLDAYSAGIRSKVHSRSISSPAAVSSNSWPSPRVAIKYIGLEKA